MTHRNRAALVLGLLAACAAPAGCSSDPDEPGLAARLERDTGVPWTVYFDEQIEAVRFLAPKTPVKVGDGSPEVAARAFFERYRDALPGKGNLDELRPAPTSTTETDGAYVRFDHYLRGTDVRVFDVVSTARFTSDGAVVWMQSGFRRNLGSVPKSAAATQTAALNEAVAKSIELCGEGIEQGETEPTSTLGIVTGETAPRLVWRVQLMGSTPRCAAPMVTIDATTGQFIDLRDGAESLWDDNPGVRFEALGEKQDVRRIDISPNTFSPFSKYVMRTESSPVVSTRAYGDILNPEITTDVLGSWDRSSAARGAAVDAHYNVMHALRYFREAHGRNSTNGRGNPISVVVHHPFYDSKGNLYRTNATNDANWFRDRMACGDGDYLSGGDFLPICSGLDVTAHELAHGVTHYSSGLVYHAESGALNESFSDAMGASAENALEVNDASRNFVIAERVMKSGTGFRSMTDPGRGKPKKPDPARYDAEEPDPDHYDNFRTCAMNPRDECGVHTNSGIPNRAFSLMTAGGVHAKSGIGVARAIGWKVARELWYDTFTKLGPDANFRTAALAQVTEASRRGPDALQAVGCAWYAVGVLKQDFAPLLASFVCPQPAAPPPVTTPSTPSCAGHGSAWVCSNDVKSTASRCANGVVETVFCADPDATCHKASVNDGTATVSLTGALSCD